MNVEMDIERIGKQDRTLTLDIDPGQGAFLSWLHGNAEVLDRSVTDEGRVRMKLRVDTTRRGRLDARLATMGAATAHIVDV